MSNDTTLPTPPVGWELLKAGDKIKQGDKFLSCNRFAFSENIQNWQSCDDSVDTIYADYFNDSGKKLDLGGMNPAEYYIIRKQASASLIPKGWFQLEQGATILEGDRFQDKDYPYPAADRWTECVTSVGTPYVPLASTVGLDSRRHAVIRQFNPMPDNNPEPPTTNVENMVNAKIKNLKAELIAFGYTNVQIQVNYTKEVTHAI